MIILIFLISLIPLITTWNSGQITPTGIPFWGPHGHDSIWHLALISAFKQNFPINTPTFSGVPLQNYHFGFDWAAAVLSRLLPLPISFLYFRLIPLLLSLLLVFLTFRFFLNLHKDRRGALIFVFLNIFAGSAGFLFTLSRFGQIGGESLFWSMQSVSFLLNPPYALSLIMCFLALNLLVSRPKFYQLFVGIILGFLPLVKIYAFFFLGSIIFSYLLLDFLKTHSLRPYLALLISAALVSSSVLIYFHFLGSGSLLTFSPFWFSHSLIEAQDKLFLPGLASWRFNAWSNLTVFKLPILLFIETLLLLIFLIGNFFVRLLGFHPSNLKNLSLLEKSFLLAIVICSLIPILFIQKGTPWNTIQFLYYSLILANFFLAKYLVKLRLIPLILILSFASVTSLGTLKDYFGYPSPAYLPLSELTALRFLSRQPAQNILTYPYDAYTKSKLSTPIPLKDYETTAYVSAYSGKPTFLTDTMNSTIIGLPVTSRLSQIQEFLSTSSIYVARGFLVNNRIDYIYLTPGQSLPFPEDQLQVSSIYSQDGIRIYRVQI